MATSTIQKPNSLATAGAVTANANDLLDNGIYRCVDGGITNIPSGQANGMLIVFKSAGNSVTQIYISFNNDMFKRVNWAFSSVSWTDWTAIYSEGASLANDNITRGSGTSSGTFEAFHCYKINGVVCASARIYSIDDSGATANKTYFQIPSGYRPRTTTKCPMYIQTSGNTIYTIGQVLADGQVQVAYGSVVITQVGFVATYPI